MLNRILQVIHALTAKMDSADIKYVNDSLNRAEQVLFYEMDTNSQKHSVNVAVTCNKLAASKPNADLILLTRAALLHDIGKTKGDLTTFRRILLVIINNLFPKLGCRLAKKGQMSAVQSLYYAFYIYKSHPVVGYQKAIKVGVDDQVLELVAKHHQDYEPGEPIELTILRQADSLN